MDEIINLLYDLEIWDVIKKTFIENNIPINYDNLRRIAIGFGLIKENSSISITLNKKTYDFICSMQLKQKKINFEQGFALIGNVLADNNGNNTIFINKFIENTDGLSSETNGSWGQKSFKKVIDEMTSPALNLKVLLLCHTHPNMEIIKNDDYAIIRNAIENIPNNPLVLRKQGLNPSIGDILQLLAMNHYFPGVMKFIGILLPNGEFNFLSYDGTSLKQISNVFIKTDNGAFPFPTFLVNDFQIEDYYNKKSL